MFDYLITDACRATGFPIRKFRNCLKNFIGSNRDGKWGIPVSVNVGKWEVLLLPEVVKGLLVSGFKCSPVRKV